jgi:hypothetical protein
MTCAASLEPVAEGRGQGRVVSMSSTRAGLPFFLPCGQSTQ